MSEMIGRVALALQEKLQGAQVDVSVTGRPLYLADLARAAIEAMREPTDKMIVEAMIQPLPSVTEAGGVLEQGRASARIEWQAMIDAALK